MKWYLVQQSRNWFLIASSTPPNLTVPAGTKRKMLRGTYDNETTAKEQGRKLAAHHMGLWVE